MDRPTISPPTAPSCPRCIGAGQPHYFASARRCAFAGDVFSPDNWNCETVNTLRDTAEQLGFKARDEDVSFGFIPAGARYIAVTWYKERGRTSEMLVMGDDETPHRPTLTEIDEAIAWASKFWIPRIVRDAGAVPGVTEGCEP